MKPLIQITRMGEVEKQLTRIADLMEFFLASQGLFLTPRDVEKDDEEILYRDEQGRVIDEITGELRKKKGEPEEEE